MLDLGVAAADGHHDLASVASEAESVLAAHSLACWFPRCIDTRQGGFHQEFEADWSPGRPGPRSLVFQSRMTWVTATMARRRPHATAPCSSTDWAEWAAGGLAFIDAHFWDPVAGGLRCRDDAPDETHSYGIAFALFAAAALDRLAPDESAHAFAAKVFDWWDATAHDRRSGGYFDALTSAGTPILDGRDRQVDLIGIPYGCRSSNTLLHVLEALTELYLARGSAPVRERLEEMVLLLDRLLARDGARLYWAYDRDWRPVDREVSFGHDVEAAYLDGQARRCLGWPLSTRSRALADRALRRGLDRRFGGLYARQRPWRLLPSRHKVGWAQAEALNTLIDLHGTHQATSHHYLEMLLAQWRFVRTHQLDHVHGGWLDEVSRDGRQVLKPDKGNAWKACYHEVRALLNVADGHVQGDQSRRQTPSR